MGVGTSLGNLRFVVWCLVIGFSFPVFGQAPPGKKTPFAPPKAGAPTVRSPVPPQKTPAPPTKTTAAPSKTTAPAANRAKPAGPKVPEPEDVSLKTKDGLDIKATYYPGTGDKKAVPFILVHGFEGQRGDFHALAVYLQSLGHAAIAPDLRGHGQSKTQRGGGGAVTLDPDKLTRAALEDMVWDIQACKTFFMEKNNAGKLNIEQLCVIGAEFGAILATHWAAMDWSHQDLPAYKLGKDVKALVLLSPPSSLKGITIQKALTNPAVKTQLSVLLVAGSEDTKASGEVKKLHSTLQAGHARNPDDKAIYLIQPDTTLSGTKLLGNALEVKEMIATFVDKRLVDRASEFAWQDRTSPVGN
jgi:alpha-beta hydrolase superfamily lysophospholipase